jgi:hypothetical protein
LTLTRRTLTIVATATLLAGCGAAVNSVTNNVSDPMTPEQSRAQVVDAANDVSRTVAQPVASAHFSRSSCNDQGEAPFRGVVNIFYSAPADPAAASNAFDDMTHRLQRAGWATDGGFQSHGTALKKNAVDAVLYPADASVAKVHVILYGECRDLTTTKAQAGISEDLALG